MLTILYIIFLIVIITITSIFAFKYDYKDDDIELVFGEQSNKKLKNIELEPFIYLDENNKEVLDSEITDKVMWLGKCTVEAHNEKEAIEIYMRDFAKKKNIYFF